MSHHRVGEKEEEDKEETEEANSEENSLLLNYSFINLRDSNYLLPSWLGIDTANFPSIIVPIYRQ